MMKSLAWSGGTPLGISCYDTKYDISYKIGYNTYRVAINFYIINCL